MYLFLQMRSRSFSLCTQIRLCFQRFHSLTSKSLIRNKYLILLIHNQLNILGILEYGPCLMVIFLLPLKIYMKLLALLRLVLSPLLYLSAKRYSILLSAIKFFVSQAKILFFSLVFLLMNGYLYQINKIYR